MDPTQNSVGTVDDLTPGGYKFEVTQERVEVTQEGDRVEVTQEGDRVKITFTSIERPGVTGTVSKFHSS